MRDLRSSPLLYVSLACSCLSMTFLSDRRSFRRKKLERYTLYFSNIFSCPSCVHRLKMSASTSRNPFDADDPSSHKLDDAMTSTTTMDSPTTHILPGHTPESSSLSPERDDTPDTTWTVGMRHIPPSVHAGNGHHHVIDASTLEPHLDTDDEDDEVETGLDSIARVDGIEMVAMDPLAAATRAKHQWEFDFNTLVSYHKRASIVNAVALVLLALLFRFVGTPLRAHIVMTERRVFPRATSIDEEHLVQNGFPVASLSFVAMSCHLAENLVCGWLAERSMEQLLRTTGRNVVREVSASIIFMCLYVQAAICCGVSDPLELFFVALCFILVCALYATDEPGARFPVRRHVACLLWVVYSALLLAGMLHTAQYAHVAPIAFVCFASMLFFGGLLYMALWMVKGLRGLPAPQTPTVRGLAVPQTPHDSADRNPHLRVVPVNFGRERDLFFILFTMQQLSAWLFVLGM